MHKKANNNENHQNQVVWVLIWKPSLSTLRWVPIHQGFSHFSGFLHHFVLAKLATSSIRVNSQVLMDLSIQNWKVGRITLKWWFCFCPKSDDCLICKCWVQWTPSPNPELLYPCTPAPNILTSDLSWNMFNLLQNAGARHIQSSNQLPTTKSELALNQGPVS